ncbi:MAG: efflux RND transporter periplasmic adaptor subunit [Proteobacteria bacterium]|nr:efflux RND transporter periplasmic adaptor subunit [Pseudomonadota bacterium]
MAMKTVSLKTILIILALVLGTCLMIEGLASRPTLAESKAPEKSASSERTVVVLVEPIESRRFEERVMVQGNLEAKNVALVPARSKGTIQSIFVDEGDAVEAGRTRLFQTDPLKFEKTVDIQKQVLAVARCAVLEKEANLAKVRAEFHKAELDYKRFKKLVERGTVSRDEFEQVDSRYQQAEATSRHAEILIKLAREQLRQAQASLVIAQKDLSDALVFAPLSGRVAERYMEPGEMGDTNKSVLRIEDPSLIEASAFLPARYYARVVPGRTKVRLQVYGQTLADRMVSYRSPTIDSRLRTFEIKVEIKDPPEGVVPGAMAEVSVLLDSREGLGVPSQALQKRADSQVVFLINSTKARMVPVKTGLSTDGWTEIQGDGIAKGMSVVVQGQVMLNDGATVSVRKEAR